MEKVVKVSRNSKLLLISAAILGWLFALVLLISISNIRFYNKYTLAQCRIGSIYEMRQTKSGSTIGYIERKDVDKVVVGDSVTLLGSGFGEDGGNVHLWGNDDKGLQIIDAAEVVSWADNQIKFIVPEVRQTDMAYRIRVEKIVSSLEGGYTDLVRWKTSDRLVIVPDSREYITVRGDSLMKIAREQLGNEGRYIEIVDLNKPIYPSFDKNFLIGVGMKLRLPKK